MKFDLKKTTLGAAAAVILATGTLGATAYAQTPSPPAARQQQPGTSYRSVFQSKLAALLGISAQTLSGHVKQAKLQTVDQMVTDGALTQEQTTQARQRIEREGGMLPFGGPGGPGGHRGRGGPDGGGPGRQRGMHVPIFPAIAQRLGITEQELMTQLRSGTKLSDLAAQKNVSKDDLKAAVTTAAKTDLDAKVAAGQMTQQQADQILQHVQEELENLWNGTMPQRGGGPRGGGQQPGQPGQPGNQQPGQPGQRP
ncbi:MAG: hypothetical protein HY329_01330 [Chloroflexi bacterium]|nr:hypothetical protein [Chloroflexota bacterium]